MRALLLVLVLVTASTAEFTAEAYAAAVRTTADALAAGDAPPEIAWRDSIWRDASGSAHACDYLLIQQAIAGSEQARSALRQLAAGIATTTAPAPLPVHAHQQLQTLQERQRAWQLSAEEPELGLPEPPPFPEWIATQLRHMGDWLMERLGCLFAWLFPDSQRRAPVIGAGSDQDISTWVWLLIILAGLFCLALLLLGLRRGRQAPNTSAAPVASLAGEEAIDRPLDEWRRLALALQAQGRHREALRAWYHACLRACFQSGVLHHQRGRTNWEYCARLRQDVAWRAAFLDLTRAFDAIWYGHGEHDQRRLHAAQQLVQQVLAALDGERA